MVGLIRGLVAVLLQKGRPVMYVSRTFTSAETGYSNIEREPSNVVFGLEILHHYVFGSKIKVQADHKPLIPVGKKSIAASSQLQCLLLCLAKYDAELTYLQGENDVIADALSHVSLLQPESKDRDNFDAIPVHHITSEIPATGS